MSNKSATAGGEPRDVVIVGAAPPELPRRRAFWHGGRTSIFWSSSRRQSTIINPAGRSSAAVFLRRPAPNGTKKASCPAVPTGSRAPLRHSRPRPMKSSSTTASELLIACSSRRPASSSIGAPSKAFPRRLARTASRPTIASTLHPTRGDLCKSFAAGALCSRSPPADQMQRRPAEGALSFLRSLVPERSSQGHDRRVSHRGWRAFRRQGLCPGADGIYQEIWRGAQFQ